MLVSSGNAQPSPRGMATDVLTTIRNCQAGSSGRAGAASLCLHGVGVRVLALPP